MPITYNCGGGKPTKENIGPLINLLLGRKRESPDEDPKFEINSGEEMPDIYSFGM